MNRTYVVSGSASGIGAATCRTLLADRNRVVGIDLADAEVIADLADPDQRRRAVQQVLDVADGRIDAVIACAGIAAPVANTVAVNYFGTVELLAALREALTGSPAPRAVAVSSITSARSCSARLVDACLAGDEASALAIGRSLEEHGPAVGSLNYTSSKRAVSRWVRREAITPMWAGAGIALNAVAPGIVLTPMSAELLSTPEGAAVADTSVPMPLGGRQPAQSIADLLVWLASEQNTHCCGQTIYCDGGAEAVLRGDDVWSWIGADAP